MPNSRGPFRSCFAGLGVFVAVWVGLVTAAPCPAQEVLPDGTQEALRRIAGFRVPEGLQIGLFAAEPQLSGPVAICLDEQGRVYVAEEYRFNRGTEENRTRPFFLDDDLQIRTLDDRLAMYRKFADRFEGGLDWFRQVSDQVRVLEDRNGDGRADASRVFAGGFNEPLDGLAAGVIARDGDVYLTCIPHLWRLRDANGDGQADVRESLLTGFGVNCAFLGHDLHGLAFGPDGRLYFSIGDRGFDVTSKEGLRHTLPRRGAVFRCDPDGSNFEVVHIGLRNPQELAFDEYGNLFAADNNCDKGDLSRLAYIVDGADSGWNMAYQTMSDPYLTGPWHAEKMWHVEAAGQPAWLLPPAGPLGAGPSGFAYYPGAGLPPRYDGHFFLCNYTGAGGVESFAVRPHGASFRIVDSHDFFKPIQATDVEFGYDGKMYVADFVNLDWSGRSLGGRIYTLHDPAYVGSPAARQTQALFAGGFGKRSHQELFAGLDHADLRVRLRCQYELARRGQTAGDEAADVAAGAILEQLTSLALSSGGAEEDRPSPRVRRHAVWALWQLGRQAPAAREPLRRLLAVSAIAGQEGDAQAGKAADDSEDDVRQQAIRALGDLGDAASAPELARHLSAASDRTRFLAALALARLPRGEDERFAGAVVAALVQMLRENDDADPYLRHAGVMGLTAWADDTQWAELASSPQRAVRLAALLVGRRRGASLSRFLDDFDPAIVTEAARAIHDLGAREHTDGRRLVALDKRPDELASLAAVAGRMERFEEVPAPLTRRVIHAHYLLGDAAGLLRLAVERRLPAAMQLEAVACLAAWSSGATRDRVVGDWRPVPARDAAEVQRLLNAGAAERLLNAEHGEVLGAAIQLLAQYRIPVDDQRLAAWAGDDGRSDSIRIQCLNLLVQRQSAQAGETIAALLQADRPALRIAGRQALSQRDRPAAIEHLRLAVSEGTLAASEWQAAVTLLAALDDPQADALLVGLLQNLVRWVEAGRPGVTPAIPPAIPSATSSPASSAPAAASSESSPPQAAYELDLVAAVEQRSAHESLARLRSDYRRLLQSQASVDPLAEFRAALYGGDAARGEQLFRTHRQAQCLRCHKAGGDGGTAGPDLSKLGAKASREHLLESIVDPSAKIAAGFGAVTLVTDDGRILGGIVKEEDDQRLVLETPQGERKQVEKSTIEERVAARSPMPDFRQTLKPHEIRDLVEFLSRQR